MKQQKSPLLRGTAYIAGVFTALTVWQNTHIITTEYKIRSIHLPTAFEGFRIAVLADIHSRNFGEAQKQILDRVREAVPDLIVVAGDWLDAKRGHIEYCITQAAGFTEIAPVYAVYGNHELSRIRQTDRDCFSPALERAGVHLLHSCGTRIERGGMFINLLGIEDPTEGADRQLRGTKITQALDGMLHRVMTGILPDEFTILLAHRPEFLLHYAKYPINLICAGHAHGGQVRLPGLGGLFAPGQGLFPKYTGGAYTEGQTTMVVSRGLGGQEAPIRILNTPELVMLELHTEVG